MFSDRWKLEDYRKFIADENYGQSGIQAFRELADKNGICIAREDSVRILFFDFRFQSNSISSTCFNFLSQRFLATTKMKNFKS